MSYFDELASLEGGKSLLAFLFLYGLIDLMAEILSEHSMHNFVN